ARSTTRPAAVADWRASNRVSPPGIGPGTGQPLARSAASWVVPSWSAHGRKAAAGRSATAGVWPAGWPAADRVAEEPEARLSPQIWAAAGTLRAARISPPAGAAAAGPVVPAGATVS